jgi:AraC-like DNA-binding protein
MGLLKVVLIIGFYQTLIFGGLTLAKKNKSQSDYFLSGLFFVFGITLLLGYLEIFNRENDYPFPHLINTSSPFILLHGPVLWFYIRSLTSQHFAFKWKYLFHFLPFILVVILLCSNIYFLPVADKILIDSTEAFKDGYIFLVVVLFIAIFTQGYFIWGLWLIGQYKKKIRNYFSEIDSIDLHWLKLLLVLSVLFYFVNSFLYLLYYYYHIFPYHVLQPLGYAFASIFILVLGFMGYKQGNIFSSHQVKIDLENHQGLKLPDGKNGRNPDHEFIERMVEFMKTEKPFTQPEITLSSLADRLNVSPEYLSGILNGILNKNFYDFINFYRVEEFKRICMSEKGNKFTIIGMAWDAGFNSKATFNRVFKKITGITPGEFVKNRAEKIS